MGALAVLILIAPQRFAIMSNTVVGSNATAKARDPAKLWRKRGGCPAPAGFEDRQRCSDALWKFSTLIWFFSHLPADAHDPFWSVLPCPEYRTTTFLSQYVWQHFVAAMVRSNSCCWPATSQHWVKLVT